MKRMLLLLTGLLLAGSVTLANGDTAGHRLHKAQVHTAKRSHHRGTQRVSLRAIYPWLNHSTVVQPEALEGVPYIVGFSDDHLVGGTGYAAYVRGQLPAGISQYSVYRPRTPYHHALSGDLLGVPLIYLGDAELLVRGEPSTLMLTNATENISAGDLILPAEHNRYPNQYVLHDPNLKVEAAILGMFDGLTEAGANQVVVIDQGKEGGLRPGDVLDVVKDGPVIPDRVQKGNVKLPGEQSGKIMVYRTFDKVSFALVTRARRPIQVGDLVFDQRDA